MDVKTYDAIIQKLDTITRNATLVQDLTENKTHERIGRTLSAITGDADDARILVRRAFHEQEA